MFSIFCIRFVSSVFMVSPMGSTPMATQTNKNLSLPLLHSSISKYVGSSGLCLLAVSALSNLVSQVTFNQVAFSQVMVSDSTSTPTPIMTKPKTYVFVIAHAHFQKFWLFRFVSVVYFLSALKCQTKFNFCVFRRARQPNKIEILWSWITELDHRSSIGSFTFGNKFLRMYKCLFFPVQQRCEGFCDKDKQKNAFFGC